ncbi:hypothetical protein AAHE18_11G143400 [Arachis hypogaea]
MPNSPLPINAYAHHFGAYARIRNPSPASFLFPSHTIPSSPLPTVLASSLNHHLRVNHLQPPPPSQNRNHHRPHVAFPLLPYRRLRRNPEQRRLASPFSPLSLTGKPPPRITLASTISEPQPSSPLSISLAKPPKQAHHHSAASNPNRQQTAATTNRHRRRQRNPPHTTFFSVPPLLPGTARIGCSPCVFQPCAVFPL